MRKNALFSAILAGFCFFVPINGYTQGFPIVLGSVLEVGSGLLQDDSYGTGITRVSPFVGIWLQGLGFARVGINTGSQHEVSEGVSDKVDRLDISIQIGFNILGAERPYIMGSYVRNKAYSPSTDAKWNEFGLGFGHRFSFSPFAALVMEAEHRWVVEHYDRLRKLDVSGRRLQMNLGMVISPL
jgi:hypothetical protein